MIYVCDNCGSFYEHEPVPEDGEWTCGECGNHAAWEFPPAKRQHALEHSLHISDLYASGIFRRT